MAVMVKDIAEFLGVNQQAVRVRMQNGTLPIGEVTGNGKVKSYLIYPKLAYEVLGYKAEGYEPPITISINVDKLADLITKSVIKQLQSGQY